MSQTRVRLLVSGVVQGVGFRYAAYDAAIECGVAGWVRNLPDGSVEIFAQGTDGAVARMTAWARQGPRHARVERVVVERQAPDDDTQRFEIRY